MCWQSEKLAKDENVAGCPLLIVTIEQAPKNTIGIFPMTAEIYFRRLNNPGHIEPDVKDQ